MKVLCEDSLEQFRERMRRFLTDLDPARWGAEALQTSPRGSLEELITSGMEKAERFGITAERDVALFLAIVSRFGVDLEHRAIWAQQILEHPRMGGGLKVKRIVEGLKAESS